MKTVKKYIIGLIGIAFVLGGFTSCDKHDYPDRFTATEGIPVIDYVRYADQDVFISQAFMDEVLCIVGENLKSVHNIFFNDQEAVLNTSFMTENTIVVAVPSTQAQQVDNKIYLVTKNGDKVGYDFKVLPPVPKIISMSNEWAKPGEIVSLTGKFFMDVQSLALPGAAVTDYTVNSGESITFKVPEGATPGPVSITTASGSANSVFQYMDSRNMLFDFDGNCGGFAAGNGWRAPAAGHLHNPGDDAFDALDGSYLWLGGQDGGLKSGSTEVWGEDAYSFNYWNSEDASSSIPALKTLPTFSSYLDKFGIGGLALKFECLVPASNPWQTCGMQLIFSSTAVVSNENMNNTFLTDDAVPRAVWAPWVSGGSWDTGGSWVTVSIPLTEFTCKPDGSTCSNKFDDACLDGFSLFVYNGPNGTDCDPVIAIDHIRVVPM